jgi:hypothetical protein
MKSLLGDFNAKVDREDIFKPSIGNVSLHKITYIHTYISHFISPKYNGHETGHRHNTNKQSRKTIQS